MAEETLELPMELGRAFIADLERCLRRAKSAIHDQRPRFVQTHSFYILQRRCFRHLFEVLVKCRDTHPGLLRKLSYVDGFEIFRMHSMKGGMNTGPLTVLPQHGQQHVRSRPAED